MSGIDDEMIDDEMIVACDWNDGAPRALPRHQVHRRGTPHRAVHVEVWRGDEVLVWQRTDGRFELPGGHVRWLPSGPEPLDEAAARELLEELGRAEHDVARQLGAVQRQLQAVTKCLNRSRAGANNEWVTVYRIAAAAVPGSVQLARPGVLSAEGNRDARWWAPRDVMHVARSEPQQLASSLKLFAERH